MKFETVLDALLAVCIIGTVGPFAWELFSGAPLVAHVAITGGFVIVMLRVLLARRKL